MDYIKSHELIYRTLNQSGVFGYNDESSGAPPEYKTENGRANPKYISYFYAALKHYTAVAEFKPKREDYLSIAEYWPDNEYRLCNLLRPNISSGGLHDISNDRLGIIGVDFFSPAHSEEDYIISQVIAEYVKSLGFQGILFDSSAHIGGQNITLFITNGCTFKKSYVYRIKDTELILEPNFPTEAPKIDKASESM